MGESTWAAEAAECANQQGKFWEYHDRLFNEWRGENVGTFVKANLKKFAADLKLDTATFNQCIDGDMTMSVVKGDTTEAQRSGINGTPAFLINGRVFAPNGLQFTEFQRALDSQIK